MYKHYSNKSHVFFILYISIPIINCITLCHCYATEFITILMTYSLDSGLYSIEWGLVIFSCHNESFFITLSRSILRE